MAEPAQDLTTYTASSTKWEDWRLSPPPAGDPGVGAWCWKIYEICRRHRDKQGLPQLWSRFHEMFRGLIFRHKSKYGHIIANLYFKTINSLKANLTDNKPRASIMPHGETPDDIADAWQARYDIWWEKTKQQYNFQESVGKSETYGFQTDKMVFDPDQEGGLGEVDTKRLDTFGVLLWPGCQDIQDQPAMCELEALELGKIYEYWPDAIGKVKADPEYSEILGESRTYTRANRSRQLRSFGTPTNFVIPEGTDQQPAEGSSMGLQRALIIRVWCKDNSIVWVNPATGEEVDEGVQLPPAIQTDPETGQEVEVPVEAEPQLRYPGGIRCITITNKGKLVLDDQANPSVNPNLPRELTSQCYLFDKFPFIKRYSYSDDLSEYGLSILEQIEPLVFEVCKKLTMYGVHLGAQCRTPLILPQNCGVKRDEVNNLPARIWEPVMSMAQHIRFLELPQATNDILNYVEMLIRLIDMITGLTDVTEGRKPKGIQAGVAISELQEKAQVVFREKIRNLDLYLEEQGRMFISLGQNWYTEERLLRYEGKKGPVQIPFRGIEAVGELDFHVEAGSTLPKNRATRQYQMIELSKAGMITPRTLLKEMEVPNADEEAARLEAGPLGMALEKAKRSGLFDDATLQALEQVVSMDDSSFNKAFPQNEPFGG